MIINSIVIENFRCYEGKNELSFCCDDTVNLIYAKAGYGKSTLLQFFMWMLYDDPDFGPNNDKPLYNITTFNSKKIGDKISVFGQINFEHLGMKYSLSRKNTYEVKIKDCMLVDSSRNLLSLVDDNWVDYKGDIPNKINSFLPKPLAKYFLLDGEKARELVLNPKGLKLAIQDLFGLNAYTNAISHIGSKSKKSSVLGYYYSQMTAKMPKSTSENDPSRLQEQLQILDDKIDAFQKKSDGFQDKIDELTSRKDELLKKLGEAGSQDSLKKLMEANSGRIKDKEKEIEKYKNDIGNIMYKSYPYLILSDVTAKNSAALRKKYNEINQEDQLVFENLKKDLMKEILEKGTCVCGRSVDQETAKYINNIIHIMPPDSYTYQFGQFVTKSKKQINVARMDLTEIDSISTEISVLEKDIVQLNKDNDALLDSYKKLGESESMVNEIKDIRESIRTFEDEKKRYDDQIASDKRTYELTNKLLENLYKKNSIYNEYKEILDFFEKMKSDLEVEKQSREAQIRKTLNNCVRRVYKELTTQAGIDVDKIEFINSDFTLRATYLTGGQQAVDVYSYVLGMIMALEEYNNDTARHETPVFVDAPFAFTDNEQSEHIFLQLPKVAKQTILLTLDVNKIENCLRNDSVNYKLVEIENDVTTNESAHFERRSIDDIKF